MKPVDAILGASIAALLFTGHANSQTAERTIIDVQTFRHIIPAPSTGQVSVSMAVGEFIVRGWDRDEIEVSGELGEDAIRVELSHDEGQTLINVVPIPAGSEPVFPPSETDIFVSMPRQSSLTFSATDAEAQIAGIHGSQALSTISGDVETEIWSGPVTAESASGDLSISNRSGLARTADESMPDPGESVIAVLTSLSGDIEARGPFDQVTASTVSGDIEVDVVDVSVLYLDTSNGDIEVRATFSAGAQVNAETINGDVELQVSDEGNLTLDLESFSGRIENCFDYEDLPSSSRSGHELHVEGPDDAPSVRVRTLNGDIEFCSL